jgi:hypothetical protein
MSHPHHVQLAAVAIRAFGPRTHTRRVHPHLQSYCMSTLLLCHMALRKLTQGPTRTFRRLRRHEIRRLRHSDVLKEWNLHVCI